MRYLIAPFLALSLAIAGCASDPAQVAFKSTAITVTTVNAFESAYGNLYRAGLVPVATQTKVEAAVNYYNAAVALEAATVTATSTNGFAPNGAAVTAAQQALIAVITPLLTPAQATALLAIQ